MAPEPTHRSERVRTEVCTSIGCDAVFTAVEDHKGRVTCPYCGAQYDGPKLLLPGECPHETTFLKVRPDGWACRDCGAAVPAQRDGLGAQKDVDHGEG